MKHDEGRNGPAMFYALSAFLVAQAAFVVGLGVGLWWFARAVSAVANAGLHHKQVAALEVAEPGHIITTPQGEPAPAPSEPKLNTRNRLSDLSDDDLAAAAMDVKVITMDENNGIDADVEPIPRGGRGVFANGR